MGLASQIDPKSIKHGPSYEREQVLRKLLFSEASLDIILHEENSHIHRYPIPERIAVKEKRYRTTASMVTKVAAVIQQSYNSNPCLKCM